MPSVKHDENMGVYSDKIMIKSNIIIVDREDGISVLCKDGNGEVNDFLLSSYIEEPFTRFLYVRNIMHVFYQYYPNTEDFILLMREMSISRKLCTLEEFNKPYELLARVYLT